MLWHYWLLPGLWRVLPSVSVWERACWKLTSREAESVTSNELWYTIQSLNLLRWMICTVHVDEMFLLNDALQPFQVSKGQAGHNISWFLYANRPLLLHSRLCVCVYFCVITHAWPQQYLPSILITPFLALIGLTEFVHVSPTPVCDLIPCYTAWHIDESPCDSLIASNRREKH